MPLILPKVHSVHGWLYIGIPSFEKAKQLRKSLKTAVLIPFISCQAPLWNGNQLIDSREPVLVALVKCVSENLHLCRQKSLIGLLPWLAIGRKVSENWPSLQQKSLIRSLILAIWISGISENLHLCRQKSLIGLLPWLAIGRKVSENWPSLQQK